MIKTKITEITEKYDADGKLVEKITKETIKESEEPTTLANTPIPYNPPVPWQSTSNPSIHYVTTLNSNEGAKVSVDSETK